MPPLGLLTVAALLPDSWELRLVDLNTRDLSEADWQWADLVMITGMLIQRSGLLELVQQAKKRGKTVVVGGPYADCIWPQEVLEAGADVVVKGEAEDIIHVISCRLSTENAEGVVLKSEERPEMESHPYPDTIWSILMIMSS